MKKAISTLLLLFSFGCLFGQTVSIEKILSESYEFKMISKGNNFPNLNLRKDSLTSIVVLLHNNISINEIQAYFGWQKEHIEKKVNKLIQSNFLKKDSLGNLKPNVFVCSMEEEKKLKNQLEKMTLETVVEIKKQLPTVKAAIKDIKGFKYLNFNDISLLVLSDILLDNWQIENVENDFLRSNRPERHGKYYYAALVEKEKANLGEAFGIYGNQYEDTLNFSMCRYGNARYTKEVIEENKKIKIMFCKTPKEVKYPVIDTLDNKKIQQIADSFKPNLLSILSKNKTYLLENYNKSIYSKEVSFEEYFIWLYHIYYTAVTNELIKEKLITLPKERVAFYILLKS
jgi:hypothetical protein